MTISAADIMTAPPITVAPGATVAETAALMAAKHISAVPVCTADGTLVGLVSEGDILRPFRESVRQQRDWWLGLIAEGEELSQAFLDYMRTDTRSASDVMVRHVITAAPDATLPQLAELMTSRAIKRIPILRDGRLVGIVSRADLVAALARSPGMLV